VTLEASACLIEPSKISAAMRTRSGVPVAIAGRRIAGSAVTLRR
jgi:hypothetical protein